MVTVKALACELPDRQGVPVSRFSIGELARQVIALGIAAQIGISTIWRWLKADAIKPWSHRSWLFPRDPEFALKAERVLDLYHGCFEGSPLGEDDFVLCADEKTSIQTRLRRHPSMAPAPGQPMLVEHEYERKGATCYLAAWVVQQARIFGRCEPSTGIEPFGRLVDQVMSIEPYASAARVFWIVVKRLLAPGTGEHRQAPGALGQPRAGAHAGTRQLAQPDRNLLLGLAAQSADA